MQPHRLLALAALALAAQKTPPDAARSNAATPATTTPTTATTCVVMTGFNVQDTVAEAINSVLAQDDAVVVFVDDGSSDATACEVRRALADFTYQVPDISYTVLKTKAPSPHQIVSLPSRSARKPQGDVTLHLKNWRRRLL